MGNWRSKFVQTERLRFHCRVQGDPDGPPLLLLHGSYATGRWWEPFLEVLPESLLAVAPDLRGCGLSDKPESGYAIEAQAEDIRQLVDVLGWRDFDLVGHSTGGAVAIEFALHHMDVLHTLTLVDSVPIEGVYSPPDTLELLAQMQPRPGARSLLTRALALLMPSLNPAGQNTASHGLADSPGASFLQALEEDASQMAPAAFTEVARAVSAWNRSADAGRLTLPTLLIWGELDTIVDRRATTRTLLAIPGANNLEVLRGVGHSPMIEAPIAFAERLIDFITQPDAP